MIRRLLRNALIAAAVSALTAAPAFATTTITMDGKWWQGLPQDSKVYVIQGMMVAYTIGWIDGVGSLATAGPTPPETVKDTMAYMGKLAPDFSKSFGTYVHEIDDFYIDHPKSLDLSTGTVLGCLADKPVGVCKEILKGAR